MKRGMAMLLLCASCIDGVAESASPSACDTALLEASTASTAPYHYALRSRGKYCDGVVGVKHSGELFLVSLTLGPVATDPADRGTLRVTLPPGWTTVEGSSATLHLQAAQLGAEGKYRLDGLLDSAGLSINRRDALDPLEIQTEQLGFKAWYSPEVLVPVVVGRPVDTKQIVVVVRASDALRLLELEILAAGGGVVRARSTVATSIDKAVPTTILIPRPPDEAHWIVKIGGITSFGEPTSDVIVSLSIPNSK